MCVCVCVKSSLFLKGKMVIFTWIKLENFKIWGQNWEFLRVKMQRKNLILVAKLRIWKR